MSKIVGGSLKYGDCRDGKDAELLRILKKKVIDEVFVPGKSEIANRVISDIEVTHGSMQYRYYVVYTVNAERRSPEEVVTPSKFINGLSSSRPAPGTIPIWNLDFKPDNMPFGENDRKEEVPGASSIAGCAKCQTQGFYPCNCNGGLLLCGNCGGFGDVLCVRCGGKGSEYCPTCNGSGFISVNDSYTDADGNYVPNWKNVTCSNCGGSGRIYCTSCGGKGRTVCGMCSGQGQVVCGRCAGTQRVCCEDCNGGGYFLSRIYVRQLVKNLQYAATLPFEDINSQQFNNRLPAINPDESDKVIIRVEDDELIDEIECPQLFDGPFDTVGLFNGLDESFKLTDDVRDGKARIHGYAFELRERELYDVFYTVAGKEYSLRYDPVSKEMIQDQDPVAAIKEIISESVERDYRKNDYKSLLKDINDYRDYNPDDNKNDPFEDRIRKMEKSLDSKFMWIGLVPALLFGIYQFVFSRRVAIPEIVILFILQGVLGGLFGRKMWRKLASDAPFATKGCILGFACLIVAVIKLLSKFVF